ncbi:MAG: M42 family metallopeptidase [Victivallales bacterium]|nr:M42 family metallopeptidase [Victivallales bacterium]
MILETLSNAFGPSGCETEVRVAIREAIQDHVDDLQVDHLGNLIACQKGTTSDLTVMVAAHMDEVGFMITSADDSGMLRFTIVGGIDHRVLPAERVLVGPDKIPGVIAIKPVHKTTPDERGKVVNADQLAIDIGAKNKGEAEGAAKKGDYGVFATTFRDMGDTVCGKAFDDRAGCAVLVELIKRGPYPFTFRPVFTTMEEIGLRGARVAGFAVNPDAAFVLEGTICDDSPKERDESPTTELGKGPAISLADPSTIADRRLVKLLLETADIEGIPCQFKQPGKGGTDAGAIHLAREGVPAITISVPCRYIHSPVSLLHKRDFAQTVDLLAAAMKRLPDTFERTRS